MTAAGLPPEDYERRPGEVIEIAVAFVGLTLGILAERE
jgi:hypothetical protein